MLTYGTLREIADKERSSKGLTKLPENFLKEALDYLKKKEKMAAEKADKYEFEASKSKLQDVLNFRERKILNFTLDFIRSGVIPGNLAPEERELFDAVVKKLQDFRQRQKEAMTGKKVELKTVSLLQEVPQFVGTDMGYYGPYNQGDIASVPAENAKLLIEKEMGELVGEEE